MDMGSVWKDNSYKYWVVDHGDPDSCDIGDDSMVEFEHIVREQRRKEARAWFWAIVSALYIVLVMYGVYLLFGQT